MRIDVHAHYFTRDYLDLLDEMGGIETTTMPGRRSLWPTPHADLEERFRVMDRAGVDVEILSISGCAPYFADEASAVKGAHAANDLYAEMVRAHPARFRAFATLPLPHVAASLAELARALDELGMVGVTLSTSVLGRQLGDPHFDPLYEEMNRRGCVLFIHPAGTACHSQDVLDSGFQWPLGAPFEDTLCALQLMQANFTGRYPNIKTILPHLGGTLPMLIHRLHELGARFVPGRNVDVHATVRSFWYDTVNGFAPALRLAVAAFGVERIVFGSDYPFWREEAHQHGATYLAEAGLSAHELEQIYAGNARALFGAALPRLAV